MSLVPSILAFRPSLKRVEKSLPCISEPIHATMAPGWTHLVRFIAEEDGQIHLGQVDAKKWPDIGLAIVNNQRVEVQLVKGSAFDGVVGETTLHISQVRSCPYSITDRPLVELDFSVANFQFYPATLPSSPRRSPRHSVHGTQLSRSRS